MKKSFYASEFLASVSKQKKRNIYLIVGDEQYFIDKVIKKLKEKFEVDEDDFDYVLLYAQETEVGSLLFELRQIPLTAERHFVILRDYEKYKATEKEKIAAYSSKPFHKSVLVIVALEFDKRLKSSKLLLENSIEIICKKPYSKNDILRWLKAKERTMGLHFESEARNYFAENVALDYLTAQNELEKIILYAGNNNAIITSSMVKETMGLTKKENVFALLNALGTKNLKLALKILSNVLQNGESPIMVISMLTNYYKTLWIIKILLEKQYPIENIKKHYLSNIYYKFQNDYLSAAKRYSLGKLREVFSFLLETDIQLKSVDVDEKVLLDILIVKILEK